MGGKEAIPLESFGTVLVQAFTSRAQIPVPGATAAFTRKAGDGKFELLALRVTGRSGKTSPVPIPAPPAAAGQSPGGAAPYALVDIWVQAPGYELLLAENAQVFPGVQSVLSAMLLPLPERASPGTRGEDIIITPQLL